MNREDCLDNERLAAAMMAKRKPRPVEPTSPKIRSLILANPIHESISRKRTFTLACLRPDFRDAQTQFVVLLTQLHDEGFTGSLQLNFSGGTIQNVETIEKQKLP